MFPLGLTSWGLSSENLWEGHLGGRGGEAPPSEPRLRGKGTLLRIPLYSFVSSTTEGTKALRGVDYFLGKRYRSSDSGRKRFNAEEFLSLKASLLK